MGLKGLNFHWGEMRQYTFPEVVGGLYKVDEMELRDLRTIPFGRIRIKYIKKIREMLPAGIGGRLQRAREIFCIKNSKNRQRQVTF